MAHDEGMSRRRFLGVAGLTVAGSILSVAGAHAYSEPSRPVPPSTEAMDLLRNGNMRFTTLQLRHEDLVKDRRDAMEHRVHPYAAVLCCADTRVSPEIVFDEGLNDLFVVRNAGNVASSSVLGSFEYSVLTLGINLVLVLGHEDCGAVKAALNATDNLADEEDYFETLIKPIGQAVERAKRLPGDVLDNAVRENVRVMMEKVRSASFIRRAGRPITVGGGIYRLKTGTVEFLDI
jgi:carbonic anhydrase